MWFNGVNFGIIFIALSYQGFVECEIDCHKNESGYVRLSFYREIRMYRHGNRSFTADVTFEKISEKWANDFALSGKFIAPDPDKYCDDEGEEVITLNQHNFAITYGIVKGVPYEKHGIGIAKNLVKRWYEEKKYFNGYSYSKEIANVSRMLSKQVKAATCAICTENRTTHYCICVYTPYLPPNNSDPNPDEFIKNLNFNSDLTTYRSTRQRPRSSNKEPTTSTDNNFEEKTTTELPTSSNKEPTTDTPFQTYPSTGKNFEEETTTERSQSSTPYFHGSSALYPSIKTLLTGMIYMTAALGMIPIIILLTIIYQNRC